MRILHGVQGINQAVLLLSAYNTKQNLRNPGILIEPRILKKETRGSDLSFLEKYRRIAIFEETTNSRVGRQKQLKEGA